MFIVSTYPSMGARGVYSISRADEVFFEAIKKKPSIKIVKSKLFHLVGPHFILHDNTSEVGNF